MNRFIGNRYTLDAVDYEQNYIAATSSYDSDASALRFRLNGKVYAAVEDPSDGYRSCLSEVIEDESGNPMKNVFSPIVVLARTKTGRDCEIVEFIDAQNGKTVLEIGTDNYDDYYPTFVANFSPENMSVNEPMREQELKKTQPKEWYDDTVF